jgi:ribA/ribD-fused uncharacterized protein
MTIKFYKTKGKYGDFSNFALYPIEVMGTIWKTSEHYFQARKFKNPDLMLAVMDANSPMKAADIGRDQNNQLRDDWEDIKVEVMREAVFAKFTQHNKLKNLLISTGCEIIIEESPYDYFWGEGADGTGMNYLGKILMDIRSLINEADTSSLLSPWEYNSDIDPYDFFWSQGEAEDVLVDWQRCLKSLGKQDFNEYLENTEIPKVWMSVINEITK